MQIPVIRALVEKYSLEELKAAETAIEKGLTPSIEIQGKDEGEQLTHAYGAAFVKNLIINENMEPGLALRTFSKKVRDSIS